ncbi:hypothetical protein M3M35_07310 [Fructilactobacillus myrtifloralis]|uniref:Uncharacterized protein n=1 Tax=Fructilactobacillus myrtifloralis TaxID=2940301 RepID=A0ABY5BPE8_9LACO|nr:hypothetical protein [Fructilactobacillus myrtifloralis]USS85090.1 hypothetical protein M3M35_07310 [Fructilactobacillus myrtifloralis]
MGSAKKELRNKKTGEVILPKTSWDMIEGIPDDLLTSDDVNIGQMNTQIPKLGKNVYQVENFSSRVIKLKDFAVYVFSGTFECDKELFTDNFHKWGTPEVVLFYLPEELKTNSNHVQQIIVRSPGPISSRGFSFNEILFRELWGTISFDGFFRNDNTDPSNDFSQRTKLDVSAIIMTI